VEIVLCMFGNTLVLGPILAANQMLISMHITRILVDYYYIININSLLCMIIFYIPQSYPIPELNNYFTIY